MPFCSLAVKSTADVVRVNQLIGREGGTAPGRGQPPVAMSFAIHKQVHPPTGVDHAVAAYFTHPIGDGGPPKGTAVPAASASSAAYRARERSRLACTCAAEPTSVSSRRCASSRSDSSCDSPAAWEGACEGGEDEAGPPADSAGKGGAEEKASDGCCAITGMPPTERAHTSAL